MMFQYLIAIVCLVNIQKTH